MSILETKYIQFNNMTNLMTQCKKHQDLKGIPDFLDGILNFFFLNSGLRPKNLGFLFKSWLHKSMESS